MAGNWEGEILVMHGFSEPFPLKPRLGDLFAVLLVAALGVGVFLAFLPGRAQTPEALEIYQDGELLRRVSLLEDQTFVIQGAYQNRVEIQGGRVAIVESDCPGEDCVHSGWQSTPGQSIVCLPNRVELRILGTPQEGEVDGVSG